MADETDASFFGFMISQRNVETVISSNIQVCEKNSDFYNVSHPNRGVALIFNHSTFDNKELPFREGTAKDRNYLEKVFKNLEFDVRVYNDLPYGEMYEVLQKVSKEDHTNSDCLVVTVMSHGDNGRIYARDHLYPPDVLWLPFRGDNCPTLVGKPKMFFLQACRGNEVDDGVQMRSKVETDSRSAINSLYTIPTWADILVMYSTYPGYYSWRSPSTGSWFIQALCEELESNYSKCDLLTMLTFVNKKVAIFHESNTPYERQKHKKKQICPIVSMLTRLVIFPPKKGNLIGEDGGRPDENATQEKATDIDINNDS